MAEHEPSIGQSDDWHTPRQIFDAPTTERTRDFLSHLGWHGETL